jgi:hypothetical protein
VGDVPVHAIWTAQTLNRLQNWWDRSNGLNAHSPRNKQEIFWGTIAPLIQALNIAPVIKNTIVPLLSLQHAHKLGQIWRPAAVHGLTTSTVAMKIRRGTGTCS